MIGPELAVGWEAWNATYSVHWRPVTEHLVRAAQISSSMTVLDLATGTGEPALVAAERVRPGGRVVGIDSSPGMLAVCRRIARAAGADNLELRDMDMQSLGFPDGSFDAVLCSFGLMAARDPVRVLAEVRRVLKPRARFAVSVWDEPSRNPLLTTVMGALPVVRGEGVPVATDPFRLGLHGELPSVIRAAGFVDFTIESVPLVIQSPTVDDHLKMMAEMSAVVNAAVTAGGDAVRDAMAAAIAPFVEGGKVRIGATVLCATASR